MMKRNKLLIPTLSALAVAPAIAITSCSKDNTEQNILDAIFAPMDLTEKVQIDDYLTEFDKLSEDDQAKELLYATFGTMFNWDFGSTKKINVHDLYKNNEGAFKINITKCQMHKENGKYYGTLLGYVSYIFEKEHECDLKDNGITFKFKANDYMMYTFDMVNVEMVINSDFSLEWTAEFEAACFGFGKFKYEGGDKESLLALGEEVSTSHLKVPNSHNWVPKSQVNSSR